MARMATSIPARKVIGGTIAAPLSVLLIYGIEQVFSHDLPEYVEAAILALLVFAAGYMTPPAHIDTLEEAP